MSRATLELFAELLGQVQLSGGHPDFDAQAERISTARKELTAALSEATPDSENGDAPG